MGQAAPVKSRFRVFCIPLSVFCLLILCACSSAPTAVPRADSVTCHTAYRSSKGVTIEREDAITFGDWDDSETLNYHDLEFHAQYFSGAMNHERSLRLWVTEKGQTAELHSTLYQLPQDSGPQNQFIGGHGFTGLNYATHPASGAELQYWCVGGE